MRPAVQPGSIFLIIVILMVAVLAQLFPRQHLLFNMDIRMPACSITNTMVDVVKLDIDFDGAMTWNGRAVADAAVLDGLLASLAAQPNQSELQIRVNVLARYAALTGIVEHAHRRGVLAIGVVHPA